MIASGDMPAAAAFVIPVCRQSWYSRIGCSTPARVSASFMIAPKSPPEIGEPVVGWENTRSSSPAKWERRRCCHSSSASGPSIPMVRAPSSVFGSPL
jgi:hypothetical protein